MMWRLLPGILLAMLCLSAPLRSQEQAPGASQDQYFSGTIASIDSAKVTVTRTVLGTDSTTRTFAITPETKIEGKPRVNVRVTVRFVTADDVDRAVHILVRTGGKK